MPIGDLLAVSVKGSVAAWRDGDRGPLILWVLGAIALAAVVVGGLAENEAAETVATLVNLLALAGLIGGSIARWQERTRA